METAMPKRRLSRFFLLGGIVGAALSLMLWLRPDALNSVTRIERVGIVLMMPFGIMAERICDGMKRVANLFKMFGEFERLRDENRHLKKRLMELENENRQLRRYMAENYRLRRLLQLEQRLPQTHVVAETVAVSSSNWVSSALFNRGTKDGVSVGDIVIAYDGLVGQVTRVSHNSCIVLFIVDKRCGAGVRVKRNGAIGFVRGTGNGKCLVRLLDTGGDLKVGDELVTSGLGGVYPSGIPVGRVSKVRQLKATQTIEGIAEPSVKFSDLHEVFIIPRGQSIRW